MHPLKATSVKDTSMGHLTCLFLLSRLTTEPETSDHHHERLGWPKRCLEAEHSSADSAARVCLWLHTFTGTEKGLTLGLTMPDE